MALDKKELGKLQESMVYSRRQLQPFRDNQVKAIKQYVGRHYSNNGSDDKVTISLIEFVVFRLTVCQKGGMLWKQ